MDKRLFRNEHEKVIAGVSSGVAEYMEVDVTIIRLLFVLSTIFLVGTGILVYVIMWIVVPVNSDPMSRFDRFNEQNRDRQRNPFGASNPFSPPPGNPAGNSTQQGWTSSTIFEDPFSTTKNKGDFKFKQKNNETGRTVGGLFLLVIGMYFLLREFDIIPFWFNIGKLWPMIFVAIGLSFILKSKQKNDWENWKRTQEQNRAGTSENPVNTDPVSTSSASPEDLTDTPETGQQTKMDDRFIKRDKQDEN